jgi:hypothetical protein
VSEKPIDKAAARRLIAEAVDSFEKLEVVSYAVRTGYAVLDPFAISKETGIPEDELRVAIAQLRKARVLEPNGPWTEAVEALVAMYDDDRAVVLHLLSRAALDRVRSQAARVFSDAFLITPKKKGDPDA